MNVFLKIKSLLDSNQIGYQLIEHAPVYTSAEAADTRGTKLKQGAKALVLKADDRFIMAVLSAEKKINMKLLQDTIKAKSLSLADPSDVRKITGCNIGSVPPFGKLLGLELYVDKSLLENETIAYNAGSHTKSIKMLCKDYVDVQKPKIAAFTVR